MTWWDDYQARRGTSERQLYKDTFSNLLTNEFKNSPFYYDVTIGEISYGVRIVDENSLTKNPNKKRLLCKPGDVVSVGNTVLWNSNNWLITDLDPDNGIYYAGIIEKCNNTLTFVINSTTYNYPCIIADKVQNNSGLEETKYIRLPDGKVLVTVANDANTATIDYGDTFIFNNRFKYAVNNIDMVSQVGLINLLMNAVVKSAEDDASNNLPDTNTGENSNIWTIQG